MIKLVVTWESTMGSIFTEIINVKYDDISSETIEHIIESEMSVKRNKRFERVLYISQLFNPDETICISSRPSGLTGPCTDLT